MMRGRDTHSPGARAWRIQEGSNHVPFKHSAPPTLLSVVAPVYNEEELVETFVRRTCAAVGNYPFELVIVQRRQLGLHGRAAGSHCLLG